MTEQLLESPSTIDHDVESGRNRVVDTPAADIAADWDESQGNSFQYIPVSPWGPIALILGIMSLTGFLGLFGIFLSLASTIVGVFAFNRIRRDKGLVKGQWMATTGFALAAFSLVAGTSKMAYDYSTECPEGYQRVNFPKEIADKQFVFFGAARRLHPDVQPFVNQKLFMKGFMYQTRDSEGLTSFVFLKDNGECCFGGKPKPYDMMWVELQDGQTTKAVTGMIAVAGTLRVNLDAGEDEPVYLFDADMVEEARTAF